MAAVLRRLLSARLQAAGAALPTGMPSEGKSRNNRPRQRTSRLWMPRNGNRLKQRTSGSEAEERTPADAVLRRQQDESLCFDASKNRCASMPARSGNRDCLSQKRKIDQVGGLSGWISFRMRERWGVVWWCWRRDGMWFGGVGRVGLAGISGSF